MKCLLGRRFTAYTLEDDYKYVTQEMERLKDDPAAKNLFCLERKKLVAELEEVCRF
jgi:hypothetical protein